MLDRLLLRSGEMPAEYRRRYLAMTRIKPIIEIDEDSETAKVFEELCKDSDNPDLELSRLTAYFMSPDGDDDLQAVYRLGVVMLLNYVQLYRYVDTLEAIGDLETALGSDYEIDNAAERIAKNMMMVLEDKSKRAARLVIDNQGNEDNIYASEAFRGMGVSATSLKEIRSAQAEISKAKTTALQQRDKSLEYLRKVADSERRVGR